MAYTEWFAFKRFSTRLLEIKYDTHATANATKWPTEILAAPCQPRQFIQIDSFSQAPIFHLFREVKIVTEPLSGNDLFDGETWVAVGQWEEVVPSADDNGHDDTSRSP